MCTNIKIEEPNSKRGLLARPNSFLKKTNTKISLNRSIKFNLRKINYKTTFNIFKFAIFVLIIFPLKTTHPQDTAEMLLNKNNHQFFAAEAVKTFKNANSTINIIDKKLENNLVAPKNDIVINNQKDLQTTKQEINNQNIKNVWVTAYSSSPDETDDDPFITASGKFVQDGFVATNILPLGTKIQIPELFGDKIFTVEDRMHWRKQNIIDVWMDSKEKAIKFGSYYTKIIILEENINNFAQIDLISKNLD